MPSLATFSRTLGEFAEGDLPGRLHEALLEKTLEGHLAGHVSRDSTAIAGREKPAPKAVPAAKPKRRVGRPPKGEQRPKELSRLQQQGSMTLEEMLEELPTACDIGVKSTGKGCLERWTGYKLHLDAIDGGIPISGLLTSASVHDSQAAIPLARGGESRAARGPDQRGVNPGSDRCRPKQVDSGCTVSPDGRPMAANRASGSANDECP